MRKLIEVALPLEAINREASREKSIRHGHPSTLHLWWARRPLASARAVLFASLVDDPGEYLPEEEARRERQRLFDLMERLVDWDLVKDPEGAEGENGVIREARYEIARSLARALGEAPPASPKDEERIEALLEKAPPVLDPFAGGGTIPLEAQRLGLKAYASDLNPVAVLINKALVEIPARFAGQPPVNPGYRAKAQATDRFPRAKGLAQDVRHYGAWMREEALRRIGHLYPDLKGERIIAWLWARTVACPNPACRAEAPLVRSFWLSKKKGKEVFVVPEVQEGRVHFRVERGKEPPVEGTVNRRGGRCLVCGAPISLDHVRREGKAGRLGARLMAVVTEGPGGRNYHAPTLEHEEVAKGAVPWWKPDIEFTKNSRHMTPWVYGLESFSDLFTPRQLVALTTFTDLVAEAREQVYRDALEAGLPDDSLPLAEGGRGARAYAEAAGVYLSFALDRLAESNNTLSRWQSAGDKVAGAFGRQALPMVWDFSEINPFSGSTRNFMDAVEWVAEALEALPAYPEGQARQANALDSVNGVPTPPLLSTDPPYYDNVPYADLSDFFYVWLRKVLGDTYPALFRTLLTPKAEELVADPYRQGGREAAKRRFEEGMRQVFHNLRAKAHPDYPLSLYYAFKQQEAEDGEEGEDEAPKVASTGWETFLQGLVDAGFQITATWPMRTERTNRPRGLDSNALASSIVLVCRPRPEDAPTATRQDFLRALRRELPLALRQLTQGSIPPVDLAQSAIGPGMAVYSRFGAVLEPDGRAIPVREALALINQVLDEFLAEEEAELDAPTRFAIAWYDQYGYGEGPYGDAETLAKAKNISVAAVEEGGILRAKGGKVRLLRPEEYPAGWDPAQDRRLSAWEVAHHLIKALKEQGEAAATSLLARTPEALAEGARALAYRLYGLAERKGRLADAQDFNLLAGSYGHLSVEARKARRAVQGELFGG
ncbi:DUF1156 domain-containing protein [Thermus thermamylovorans]|uniref:DUF1156 domain-containing protein n=1 Tax=Thermus thermamylovorans TaxID=2509362 RepID=A0A4Q9B1H8_9DEIN|nr:DUF1156 domain-containing protein [Thermus thermamylovorans]TBH17454.1 DUF1156 domain-containing protein [Thermus thermamylovorans]